MNWKEIEPRTIELRKALLSTLSQIRKESEAENILNVSPSLLLANDLLSKPTYDIVICGEVKKGKSTFINAIIGQELLPTGVKETTSQVFRISNSTNESFSLVFTDETNERINREELSRYGSQVDADLMGEPIFRNRQLDYIQVNIPIEFLPIGVSIVDTPGLGALYKSHELITNRYVQNAAAVVFLFDPSQPMVQQERLFLEKVFNVTPFVMFVMTKIDSTDEVNWVNQISRTETLLKDSFSQRCYTTPKVFPVSSTLLFKASEEKDEDVKAEQVEYSYFPAAQAELLKVMYITVGLSRTRFAWNEANKHKNKVLLSLEEQLKMITATTKEEQEKVKEKKAAIRQSFEQLWGPASTKRKEVMQEVQSIIAGVQNRVVQLTSTSGPIYKKYLDQIERLQSISGIQDFADSASKRLISDVSSEWQAIATSAQNEIMATLNVLHAEMEKIASEETITSSGSLSVVELSFGEKFQSYKSKYFDAAITTTVGATLLGLAGIAVAPFAPLIFIGTVVFGWLFGNNDAEQKAIEKNKVNLKSNLANMMNEVHSQLFVVPVAGGHKSMVQNFTSGLANSVEKAMATMYENQKKQFETEQKRLDEQARLGAEQKQKELTIVNEQRKQWLEISVQIAEEEKLISFIQKSLA